MYLLRNQKRFCREPTHPASCKEIWRRFIQHRDDKRRPWFGIQICDAWRRHYQLLRRPQVLPKQHLLVPSLTVSYSCILVAISGEHCQVLMRCMPSRSKINGARSTPQKQRDNGIGLQVFYETPSCEATKCEPQAGCKC